jgi:hypothetical protein
VHHAPDAAPPVALEATVTRRVSDRLGLRAGYCSVRGEVNGKGWSHFTCNGAGCARETRRNHLSNPPSPSTLTTTLDTRMTSRGGLMSGTRNAVIVTGAGGGIGGAAVRLIAARGTTNVTAVDVNAEGLDRLA